MRPKILVVDDEPYIRKAVSLAFSADCDVIEAQDGRSGLAAWARHQPDFVFLDVGLPDMTGIELLNSLRGTLGKAQVVMLTASSDLFTVRQALAAGAVQYVTKPFDVEQLKAAVRARLGTKPDAAGRPWRSPDSR